MKFEWVSAGKISIYSRAFYAQDTYHIWWCRQWNAKFGTSQQMARFPLDLSSLFVCLWGRVISSVIFLVQNVKVLEMFNRYPFKPKTRNTSNQETRIERLDRDSDWAQMQCNCMHWRDRLKPILFITEEQINNSSDITNNICQMLTNSWWTQR